MKNNLVYIVEDDQSIRELESYALKNSDFEVSCFESGRDFYAACESTVPDLVILDIMLPGEDGIAILRHIRESSRLSKLPVIMVTAKTSEIDAVKGLDAGADDYMTKPFGVMELISRSKALLRRIERVKKEDLVFNSIIINESKHIVTVDSEEKDLTYKEYEILKYLIKNKGIVLSRDTLMEKIWGYDFEQGNRTVDVHIQSLRKKLGDAGEYIKTIRNVGYKVGE